MDGIRALTFDCYGTLIDWDGGIRAAAAALEGLEGCDLERLLHEREAIEAGLEQQVYRPYGEILAESLQRAAALQGRAVEETAARRFAEGMGAWPPFLDSTAALRRLRARFRLAILSNVETAALSRSVALLGVAFDELVTAEEVRSYKPARAHWDEGLARLGLPSDELLHVAGSLFHDIRPASALGWRTAFVDRRGLGVPEDAHPDLVVPSLAALADALGA